MTRYKRKATIVTGASRGIGRAIALRVARDTAVVCVGTDEAKLAEVVAAIRKTGGRADFVVGDVADPATADSAVACVKKNRWALANLVCNAGIGKGGAAHTFDKNVWKRMFDVNVNGAFWFIQACLPEMIERKAGSICLINSVLGLKGYKYDTAYAASKHAQIGMAKSLAMEYAKHGITVVPICPSFVDTDMTAKTIAGLSRHRNISTEQAREIVVNANPQRRIIPPEEVAELVAFVLANRVPSLNGNPLVMSGGE